MRYFKNPLPKFSNETIWHELKRQCFDGTIQYEDFPADEYKYFDRLRIIYSNFKFNGLPKEEAAISERLLYKEYTDSKDRQAAALRVYTAHQDNIKQFDSLLIDIAKAKTAEDKLIGTLQIVGAVIGDTDFVRRNMNDIQKIERI